MKNVLTEKGLSLLSTLELYKMTLNQNSMKELSSKRNTKLFDKVNKISFNLSVALNDNEIFMKLIFSGNIEGTLENIFAQYNKNTEETDIYFLPTNDENTKEKVGIICENINDIENYYTSFAYDKDYIMSMLIGLAGGIESKLKAEEVSITK